MNKEMIFGLIRHALTVGSGALVVKGVGDEGTWEIIIGGAMAALGVAWSIYEKAKA